MFSDYHPNWKAIITVLVVLALIAYSSVLAVLGAQPKIVIRSLFQVGSIILVISLIWYGFERSWWLCSIFRGWLVNTPDLRGRWVGKSVTSYDKKERKMTLEIYQTLLNVQCIAYGPGNKAEGYSARLLSDKSKRNFKLAYLYHARRSVEESVPGDEHQGIAILDFVAGPPKRLVGRYVNDRDPQPRKADVFLEWESYDLKCQL